MDKIPGASHLQMVNVGGIRILTIQATAAGTDTVVMADVRSWEVKNKTAPLSEAPYVKYLTIQLHIVQ